MARNDGLCSKCRSAPSRGSSGKGSDTLCSPCNAQYLRDWRKKKADLKRAARADLIVKANELDARIDDDFIVFVPAEDRALMHRIIEALNSMRQ